MHWYLLIVTITVASLQTKNTIFAVDSNYKRKIIKFLYDIRTFHNICLWHFFIMNTRVVNLVTIVSNCERLESTIIDWCKRKAIMTIAALQKKLSGLPILAQNSSWLERLKLLAPWSLDSLTHGVFLFHVWTVSSVKWTGVRSLHSCNIHCSWSGR